MSHDLTNKFVKPLISNEKPTFFILVDNLRLDQWMMISPLLKNYFLIEDNVYSSILPTSTQYSRNSIFPH